MLFNVFIAHLLRVLLPIACIATTYLYLYPVWLGCAFPSTDGLLTTALRDTLSNHLYNNHDEVHSLRTTLAPFRLLVLADPQLEGDSSLPDPDDALTHKLATHWESLTYLRGWRNTTLLFDVFKELITSNIPTAAKELRKRVDLFGNDYYLAHIFRTLHWWTKPTHVTVLGDLIGSQWVDDEEFDWRAWRYWNRVFAGGHKVEDKVMNMHHTGQNEVLMLDDATWRNKIINIAGNHDIGYAGDISRSKMERFEKAFGMGNWDVRFRYPSSEQSNISDVEPTLHLVVLNSMLLDTPAMDEDLQQQTYEYLNSIIRERVKPIEDRSAFTLLLTHVPLHKKEGVCIDAPFFDFWDDNEECDGACKSGGLKEQNHLSEYASQSGVLQSLFGMNGNLDAPLQGIGRPGLILNGHDHEGCDVWHYIPSNMTMIPKDDGEEMKTNWEAVEWSQAEQSHHRTGIREVTLRSMMGEFGGNAGLLSAWFDFNVGEWKYDIQTCRVGVQHIWWATHVLDIIVIVLILFYFVEHLISSTVNGNQDGPKLRQKGIKID